MACPPEDQLQALADGSATAAVGAQLRSHVDSCDDCLRCLGELLRSSQSSRAAESAGAEVAPQTEVLTWGSFIGRYVILNVLGSGASGVVYTAFDPELKRKIALKVLRADLTVAASFEKRLQREAQAMARLSHPNVVTLYDVGTWGGRLFLAMELIEGQTLRAWLEASPRSPADVLAVFAQAGAGLVAAHAAGIVHRDFKTENVLVGRDGRARVTDFGLAHAERDASDDGGPQVAPQPHAAPDLDDRLTQTGAVLGTPAYMAPEQLDARPATPAADQFSFCVSVYEGLFGERPFAARSFPELRQALRRGPPLRPPAGKTLGGQTLGAREWRALRRGLSFEPGQRFPELSDLLQALAPHRTWVRLPALAAVAAAAVVGIAAWYPTAGPGRCRASAHAFDSVWSPAQKAALQKGFEATGLVDAADSWRSFEKLVDHFTTGWVQADTELCLATPLRKSQASATLVAQRQCLADGREEVADLLGLLAAPSADSVRSAVRVASGLPSAAGCRQVHPREVVGEGEDPAPLTPEQAAARRATRARLLHALALEAVGSDQSALTEATAAASAAQTEGAHAVEVRAQTLQGRLIVSKGNLKDAVPVLSEAARAALALGDDATFVDAVLSLSTALGDHVEEAERWLSLAQAAAQRLPGDFARQAAIQDEQGSRLLDQGKREESLVAYQAANALAVKSDDQLLSAQLLAHLSDALRESSRLDESLEKADAALAIKERLLGPRSPGVADLHRLRGNTLLLLGRLEEAEREMRLALAIDHAALRDLDATTALDNDSLSSVLLYRGDWAAAREAAQAALSIREQVRGTAPSDLASTRGNLGFALFGLNRFQESKAQLERSLRDIEASIGKVPGLWPDVASDLALTLLSLGENRRALALAQESVTIEKQNPEMGDLLTVYGMALIANGKSAQALGPLEAAWKLRAHDSGPLLMKAETAFALARALAMRGGDPARAQALAVIAREDFAKGGGDRTRDLAEVAAWLARPAHPTRGLASAR